MASISTCRALSLRPLSPNRFQNGKTSTMALPIAKLGIKSAEFRTIKPLPKRADSIYQSPEHRAWRKGVIDRAGARCEAMDGGKRCRRAAPYHRMFADHIIEIKDGGPPFDLANGQCLCGKHHSAKTAAARAARR